MNMFQYIASLVPVIGRKDVLSDINVLKEELRENTLPPYQQAVNFFAHSPFSAKTVKEYDKLFRKTVDGERKYSGNFLASIAKTLENSDSLLGVAETMAEKVFDKDKATSGFSYSHANVLRFVEIFHFTFRYARRLLMWTYREELDQLSVNFGKPLTAIEEKWLIENRRVFFQAIKILQKLPKDVKARLELAPNLPVDEIVSDTAVKSMQTNKIDVLETHLLPVKINPIYHIRMLISEYQASRFKAIEEEKKALEFRLLALKEASEGNRDAKLEQQIEYVENRLQKLNYRLDQYLDES